MKGFRIEIEEGLTSEQDARAREYADGFIEWSKDRGGYATGGYRTYFKRNTLGFVLDPMKHNDLVFRRISKHRRIFGVVRMDHLQTQDGKVIPKDDCYCSSHLGGMRVIMNRPETYVYHEEGIIKG